MHPFDRNPKEAAGGSTLPLEEIANYIRNRGTVGHVTLSTTPNENGTLKLSIEIMLSGLRLCTVETGLTENELTRISQIIAAADCAEM